MIVRLSFFILIFAAPLLAQPSADLLQVSLIAEKVDSIIALNSELVITAVDSEHKLSLHTFKNGIVTKSAETASLGHIWSATAFGSGKDTQIIVVYGLGRGDLNAPLRAVSYSLDLKNEKTIYTFPTERAQMIKLAAHNDRLLTSFFSSKYETETGYLTPSPDNTWKYEKVFAVRMGTSIATQGENLIIGRMYGDIQGQDGDLLWKEPDSPPLTLPSYRGVSSVALFGQQLLIGDGWQANYGQMAQARLSLLSPLGNSRRFALEILKIFPDSYAVNKIIPTTKDTRDSVLLVTNNRLIAAKPSTDWTFKDLYTQQRTDSIFDVQLMTTNASEIYVIIADGSANLYKVTH